MCGIVGYVGHRDVVPLLVDGLKKLEYRGYDSAGIVVVEDGKLSTIKAEGKLDRLRDKLDGSQIHGVYGLGHTRWATHGPPSERNAHPMVDSRQRLALIHNGIIENFLPLKQRLQAEGWSFSSDTDTEVIANLVSSYLDDGNGLQAATQRAVSELRGMYAFACVTTESERQEVMVARQGPPLLLGIGVGTEDQEMFLASDPAALLRYTRNVVFLENGDTARLRVDGYTVWDASGNEVERKVHRLDWDVLQIEKGGYKHFMSKEIHEQPQALQDTLSGRVDFESGRVHLDGFELDQATLRAIRHIHLLACGTSWHAAHVGKFLIEELVRVPVQVDYGSEYRYRDPIVDEHTLAIGITQSGETADTLASMEIARERGGRLATICNVVGSQATRISEGVLYTHAGPEIGVASTKAFTTQLEALYLLAIFLRQARGRELDRSLLDGLAHLPQAVVETLELEGQIEEMARRYHRAQDFLYLGRGLNYPIALEGALKLKEISYIHAEGYPAGEMKHGPIALIDEDLPTVALATGDRVSEKVVSNMLQVKARDGKVIAVTDRDPDELEGSADDILRVPSVGRLLQPIVNVVPLQLLAYHVGVRLGCDVDQPRNLAKSVTVE
ncbi:MAG: glutamine--fructose-6-phosphate transaminase (isomerizing) [Thermoanaerobaculia bacterium]|nr:glutamine--fructose-6-phosphate transaminase (isomerizing) [Thermoanaerobaculia bacterium]